MPILTFLMMLSRPLAGAVRRLIVSYVRGVIGPQFAFQEAAGSQFVYPVLLSYAFFLEGFTGLSVTIRAIVTLFVVMHMTARVQWSTKFGPMPRLRSQRS